MQKEINEDTLFTSSIRNKQTDGDSLSTTDDIHNKQIDEQIIIDISPLSIEDKQTQNEQTNDIKNEQIDKQVDKGPLSVDLVRDEQTNGTTDNIRNEQIDKQIDKGSPLSTNDVEKRIQTDEQVDEEKGSDEENSDEEKESDEENSDEEDSDQDSLSPEDMRMRYTQEQINESMLFMDYSEEDDETDDDDADSDKGSSLSYKAPEQVYQELPETKHAFYQSESELDRINYHHYALKYTTKTNIAAPVQDLLKKGGTVLDVGCGPGIWVLEMAADFPNSTFKGFDIAPTFPSDVMPPNVEFFLADLLKGLPYPDGTFDFIFCRSFIMACEQTDWETKVVPELIRLLKPGGWIELVEGEVGYPEAGPKWRMLDETLIGYLESKNINHKVSLKIRDYLRDSKTFTNIGGSVWNIQVAIPEDDPMCKVVLWGMTDWIRTLGPLVCAVHKMTVEEWEVFAQEVIDEIKERKNVFYYHFAYGQKV